MDTTPSSTEKNEQEALENQSVMRDAPSVAQSSPSSPLPFVIAAVVFVALLGAIGYVYMQSQTKQTQVTTDAIIPKVATQGGTAVPTVVPSPKVAQKHITKAVAAKGVDPKTGEAAQVASTFGTKDPTIYVVTSLQSVKVGTKVSYTRYIKDVLVDHKTVTLTKSQTNNVSFLWSLKKGTTRVPGTYTVKLYVDGAYENTVTYIVK